MNNRRAILLATTVVIIAGVVVVMTLRGFAARTTAPATATADATVAPAAGTSATSPAPPPAAAEAAPPWAQAGTTADPAVGAVARSSDPQRAEQMRQLQQSMRGIMAEASKRSGATNAHMRKALDTLQQMDDPAVTSQIDLDAVRHNFEISIRMQGLAQELQQAMAEPVSPARQQRLEATLRQFRQLQSQLRPDVRAAGSTAVLPTFPTAPVPASTP